MIGITEVLLAGGLPCLVGFSVRWLLLKGKWERCSWPWAVAIGCVLAYVALGARGSGSEGPALLGWLNSLVASAEQLLNPAVAKDWLPMAAVVAAAVTSLPIGRWAVLVVFPLAVVLPTRLLWGSVYFVSEWTQREAIVSVAMLGAGLAAIASAWLLSERGKKVGDVETKSEDKPLVEWTRAGLVCVATLAVALGMMLSGTQAYGELSGAAMAACLGALLAGLCGKNGPSAPRGVGMAGPVVAAWTGGLLVLGCFYAELKPVNACLLGFGLFVAGARTPIANGAVAQAAVHALVCLVPIGLALSFAGLEFAEAMRQQAADPYLNWKP